MADDIYDWRAECLYHYMFYYAFYSKPMQFYHGKWM